VTRTTAKCVWLNVMWNTILSAGRMGEEHVEGQTKLQDIPLCVSVCTVYVCMYCTQYAQIL